MLQVIPRIPQGRHHDSATIIPSDPELAKALSEEGIPSTVHDPIRLRLQPEVADTSAHRPSEDTAAAEVPCLPMHPLLTQNQAGRTETQIELATG